MRIMRMIMIDKTAKQRALMCILVLCSALTAIGCVSTAAPAWKYVGHDIHKYSGKMGFAADLPAQWLSYEDAPTSSLLLTRHSTHMDFIHIKRFPLSAPLPHTELELGTGMLPHELAEIIVNNLRAAPGVFGLAIEELAPDSLDGRDAFRVTVSYAMENGLRRRAMICGFLSGGYYNEIGLYALEDYYFDAVLDDFLALAASFKVTGKK